MKFNDVFSFENMYASARKCCNGVRWKTSTQNFENELIKNVVNIRKEVLNKTYKSKGFHRFTIHERGKVRLIESVHISERMVQKCLCDYYLIPKFTPKLIYDNGACLKGKGTGFAIKRLKTHLHRYSQKYGNTGYILLFDISNFFGSINHSILLKMVKDKFEDSDIYNLYEYFINCFDGEKGLGLGSQVSQVSASIYLSYLDHKLKDELGIKYYGRYMDDGYIICNSKEKLQYYKQIIIETLNKLKLELNPHKTQIVKLSKGFKFLKRYFMLYDNLKIVVKPNKKNILRYKQKYKKLNVKQVGEETIKVLEQTFVGYLKEFNYYDRYTRSIKCTN